MLVAFVEPALHQIANHRDEFLQRVPLRRHLRLVTNGDERAVLLLDLEGQFLLHGLSLLRPAIQVNAPPWHWRNRSISNRQSRFVTTALTAGGAYNSVKPLVNHWLFRSVVTSSLLYQNYQSSQIREATESIESILRGAADERALQNLVKEQVYTLRKGLENAKLRALDHPHCVYLFASAVKQCFQRYGITTASFVEIRDKEYFDETVSLAVSLEFKSGERLPEDQRHAIAEYMKARDCIEPLEQILVARRAVSLCASLENYHAERNGRPDSGLGCGVIGCASIIVGGIVCHMLGNSGPADKAFGFGILSIVATFAIASAIVAMIKKVRSLPEPRTRQELKDPLAELGERNFYASLPYKDLKGARAAREDACAQLVKAGVDPNQSTKALESKLDYCRAVIASCAGILE